MNSNTHGHKVRSSFLISPSPFQLGIWIGPFLVADMDQPFELEIWS